MNVNPALATAATYNCKGHTLDEHILVYWVGPFIGVLASIALFNHLVEEDTDTLGVTLKRSVSSTSTTNLGEEGQGDTTGVWKNGVTTANGVNGHLHHENGVVKAVKNGHQYRGSKKAKKGKRGHGLKKRSGAKMSSG